MLDSLTSSIADMVYSPHEGLLTRSIGDATTPLVYITYGAVASITDPDNVITRVTYAAAHRLTTITDALLQYTLDASGNRTAEKTFATGSSTPSRTLTRTYNTLDQLTQVVDGLNHIVFDASASGSYDGNGNLLQPSDANGIVRQQSYDSLNRLVQKKHSENLRFAEGQKNAAVLCSS